MPYLDQGEFFSEFGNYDVSITLPANYLVAATGNLQNEQERELLDILSNDTTRMGTAYFNLPDFPLSSK